MNKQFFILVSLFFLMNLNAQTHRFIYEYKFVPDSTRTDSIITENTRLEIFKDHSEFVSDLNAKLDSAILFSSEKNSGEIGRDLPLGKFKNKVWKSKGKVYSTEFIGIETFKVLNKTKLDWMLTDETRYIQNYHCQKAVLNYGNRNWEAWFTNEIPIQDGPFIFQNLPGLIVQIHDSNKHHSFLLIANYKTIAAKSNLNDDKMFKSYELTREQFNKKWNDFRKNPMGGSEQFMLMNPDILGVRIVDENGREKNMNEVRIQEKEQAKKLIEKQNNFIDLELYK